MSYPIHQYQPPQQPHMTGEPPLWAPYYGATIQESFLRFFKKYATFTGRASRSEYWWFALVSAGVIFVLNVTVVGAVLAPVWGLATLIPSLAITARRLHDANMSAWLMLLLLVPALGAITLLVLTVQTSNPAGMRYDVPAY